MNWRGCNFFHGRLPLSPTFYTEDEAIEWLRFQVKGGAYYKGMILTGHHAGESLCMKGCDDRMVDDWINFSNLKEDKTNDS
jgi:hypothetical protein